MLDIDKKEVYTYTHTHSHSHPHTYMCTQTYTYYAVTLAMKKNKARWRNTGWCEFVAWQRLPLDMAYVENNEGGKPAKILEKNVWGRGNGTLKVLRLLGERIKRLKKKKKVLRQKQALHVEELPKKSRCLKLTGPNQDPREMPSSW